MAASVEKQGGMEHVPSWGGQAKGWRRYVKEVQLYMLGTKPSLRPYLASKLITKLSGPARLLAMTWQLQEFNGPDGVRVQESFERFSGEHAFSNGYAASIMAQYFAFKRYRGEAISNFLIREALHYEEFRECLIRLKEEKSGVDPARDGFGLPTVDEESASEAPDSDAPTVNASPDPSERRRRYARIPTEDPGEPLAEDDEAVLSVSDSFILEQLRGWRLLTSASLSSDEWRDVLGTTQGKLDYNSISDALQVLYDEQMTGGARLQPGHPQQLYHGQHLQAYVADEPYDDEWSSTSSSTWDDWNDDSWSSWNAALTWGEDPWSYDSWCFQVQGQGQEGLLLCGGRLERLDLRHAERQGQVKEQVLQGQVYGSLEGKGQRKGTCECLYAYALNHYGLEMELQAQQDGPPEHALLASKKVVNPRQTYAREITPGNGMIDSGATCSAGPETSVQRLVTKIMEADPAAQIRVETKYQPRFRFGPGKWEQALYKLTISSSIIGSPRSFSCFALPDPEERHEDWFTLDMLVPVLVGMDWLREAGAVLDFNDGHCFLPLMNGVVLNLPQNQKGHYHSLEFFPIQFSDVCVSEQSSGDGKFSQAFEYMVNKRMKLSSPSSVRLMGNRLPFASLTTTSSPSSHAEGPRTRAT
eukprot:s5992_g5.t1